MFQTCYFKCQNEILVILDSIYKRKLINYSHNNVSIEKLKEYFAVLG